VYVSTSSGSRLFSQSSEESPQDDDEKDAGVVGESGGLKRRRWGIKGLVRPLSSLALMTLSLRGVCSVEPAQASAPVVLRPAYEQVDPLEQAMTDARKKRFQDATQEKAKMSKEWMQLADREGPAAAAKAEAAYNTLQAQQMEAKAQALAKLKRSLLEDQGICHLVDPEGARLVFLEEEGLNLNFVAGTEQARDAMDRRANPEAFDKLRALHRSIVKSIVQDVQNRGGDTLEYFKDEDNKEMTQRIYQLNAREATLLSRRYAANMETYGSTKQITPEQMEERKALKAAAEQKASASSSSSSSDKAQLKEAKQKQKAERKAAAKQLKEEKRATAQKQKEEKQAARALLKQEKAGAKAAAVAATAAAAGTAALAGSAAASTVATDLASSALSPTTPSTSTTVISEQVKEDGFRVAEDNEDDGMSLSKAISDTKQGMKTKAKKSSSSSSSGKSIAIVPAVVVAGGGAFAFKTYRDKSAQDEEERQRQFKLIMGQDDDDEEEDDEDDDVEDDFMDSSEDKLVTTKKKSATSILPADVVVPKKKKRMGIASVFSKNKNSRETNLDNLVDSSAAQSPEFSALLAKILTFGAPGRFPHVQSLSGGMPFDEFDLEKAKELLTEAKEEAGLTDETAAEAFAGVVNCMIIDIIDLASSTLKGKKEKMTVDALTVVMDFMDHAASLFDSLAQGVTIKPVTYGGSLGKGKLEQMYGIFAAAAGMDMEGSGSGQERVDTLQVVLNIADKKAEGITQNQMMKKLMQMMKDGEMPEGMEDMAEMMKGMEGMEGGMPGGMPGMPGGMPGEEGDMNPEEVKNMLLMMKEAIDSGTMPKEELKAVRAQFKEAYGQSIDDLIKDASEQKGEMSKEEAELLDLMKSVLSD